MLVVFNILLIAALAYVLGSTPTAIIAGKVLRGIDIREHGSGNAGGTNVFRVLGWQPGVAVILIDMLKGLLATLFVAKIALFGLLPVAAAICIALFFAVAFSTRYVSLASVSAAVALPFVLWGLAAFFARTQPPALYALSVVLAMLIVFTHRSNIKRLLNGTENRFGQKQAG